MTTAQVVETSVTVNDNIPIQDYVHPDDQTQPTFETSSAVLSHGAFHLVCSYNFWVCGWNTIHGVTMISHRPSSTWYYLFTILVLTFESVDEILWFDHWIETSALHKFLHMAPVLFSILQNRICELFSGILILGPVERVNYRVSSDTWIGPMPCSSSFSRLGVIFSGNEPITTRFEGFPPLDAFVTTTRFAFESGVAPDDLVLLSEGPTTIRC